MSFTPVTLAPARPGAGLVLTCEHASPAVPPEYANLGLAPAQLRDHIGWDVGAATVTEELSRQLGAPAVLSAASRLLVDCNRDLTDADLMPHQSHGVAIPGNARIESGERRERLQRFYDPYHAAVDATVRACQDALLLSVHTFTPELNGHQRPFDVGVLFDDFVDLANALAADIASAGFAVRMNEPYSALDGLIFSARCHGRRHRTRYLELEINNRLLRHDHEARAVARRLVDAVGRLVERSLDGAS
ncbi:N-formylglutamate amidohydrolase [bacterium]|nr:N-formylglutamate amidohydrolase [bacterium]